MNKFYTRATTFDDFEAVLSLIQAHLALDYQGENTFLAEDLQQMWKLSNLQMDTCVISDSTGQIIAYIWAPTRLRDDKIVIDPQFYILPEVRGKEVEKIAINAVETRGALSQEAPHIVLQPMVTNKPAAFALEEVGYKFELAFQKMVMTFDQTPISNQIPAGLEIRPFVTGQNEQAAYEADEEASLDKGYSRPTPYEQWVKRMLNNPELCFLAWDNNQVAGGVFTQNWEGQGLVHHLGVRQPWRGRGLGGALMQATFAACFKVGLPKVWLEVDTMSQTGANRLYERIGMRVVGKRSYYTKKIG